MSRPRVPAEGLLALAILMAQVPVMARAQPSPGKPSPGKPPHAKPGPHGGGHHGGHGGGAHGNPADMDAYTAHLEDPARDAWQKPDQVVAALGLKPGSVVCDVGAGPGYMALRAARAVGPTGHVFALDVEPRMVDALRQRAGTAKVANITPVLTDPARPSLPASQCDVVLIVNTYHHFPDAPAYLKGLRTLLKAGGTVVNIDFHKRDTPMGPPMEMRISREAFLQDATAAGFKLAREEKFLPHQYFVVLARG